MDKFHVFVYMLMRDVRQKQRIPCIMRISLFGAFSAGKKCALYMGKYGMNHNKHLKCQLAGGRTVNNANKVILGVKLQQVFGARPTCKSQNTSPL